MKSSTPEKLSDKSLKDSISKNFFQYPFKDIHNHPALEKLELTEEEILKNRYEVKQVIQSHQECGDSKILCNSLKEHWTLKRNKDNDLILCTYPCTKKKNYREIGEWAINKKIEESMKKSKISFTLDEVTKLIDYLKWDDNKIPKIIKNQHIGDPNYCLKNIFSTYKVNTQEKNKHFIYLFHAALIDMDSMVIKSEEVRQLALNQNWSQDKDNHLFNDLKTTPLLVILDFGMESNVGKNYYYLDFMANLLSYRHKQQKITCIFTPISWQVIREDIIKNNYYLRNGFNNEYIQKVKMDELSETIKTVFSSSHD